MMPHGFPPDLWDNYYYNLRDPSSYRRQPIRPVNHTSALTAQIHEARARGFTVAPFTGPGEWSDSTGTSSYPNQQQFPPWSPSGGYSGTAALPVNNYTMHNEFSDAPLNNGYQAPALRPQSQTQANPNMHVLPDYPGSHPTLAHARSTPTDSSQFLFSRYYPATDNSGRVYKYNRNDRPPPHMVSPQPTGNLAARLRAVHDRKANTVSNVTNEVVNTVQSSANPLARPISLAEYMASNSIDIGGSSNPGDNHTRFTNDLLNLQDRMRRVEESLRSAQKTLAAARRGPTEQTSPKTRSLKDELYRHQQKIIESQGDFDSWWRQLNRDFPELGLPIIQHDRHWSEGGEWPQGGCKVEIIRAAGQEHSACKVYLPPPPPFHG